MICKLKFHGTTVPYTVHTQQLSDLPFGRAIRNDQTCLFSNLQQYAPSVGEAMMSIVIVSLLEVPIVRLRKLYIIEATSCIYRMQVVHTAPSYICIGQYVFWDFHSYEVLKQLAESSNHIRIEQRAEAI